MKIKQAIVAGGILAVFILAGIIQSCAPAVDPNTVVESTPSTRVSGDLTIERFYGGVYVYRITDKTNHTLCYSVSSNGIFCMKNTP